MYRSFWFELACACRAPTMPTERGDDVMSDRCEDVGSVGEDVPMEEARSNLKLSYLKLSYLNWTSAKASAVSPMLVCIVKFKNASRYSRSGISDVSCYQQARKHCTVSPMLVCIFRFKHTPRYLRRWFEWANGGVEKVAPHVPPRRFDGKMMFCNKERTMFWCRTRRLDFFRKSARADATRHGVSSRRFAMFARNPRVLHYFGPFFL